MLANMQTSKILMKYTEEMWATCQGRSSSCNQLSAFWREIMARRSVVSAASAPPRCPGEVPCVSAASCLCLERSARHVGGCSYVPVNEESFQAIIHVYICIYFYTFIYILI